MAFCIEADNTGNIILGSPAVYDGNCPGAVVLSPAEHEQYLTLASQSEDTLYQCKGVVTNSDTFTYTCSVGWEQTTPNSFDPASLDPVLIAGAVGVGFFVLLPVWGAATGVKHLISLVK